MFFQGVSKSSLKKVFNELENGNFARMFTNKANGTNGVLYFELTRDMFVSFEDFESRMKFEAKCAKEDFKFGKKALGTTGTNKVWFEVK